MKATMYRLGLWFLLIFIWAVSACGPIEAQYDDSPQPFKSGASFAHGDIGGGQNVLLHLPFPAGTLTLCTQGAKGDFSHDGPSTCYDLDFDTSNSVSEELYAPASGIVRVHYALLTGSPFGDHLNIDLGNGTYVVIAHLQTMFVCDGCEVAAGQLIAFEGCTGACTGDHVHIGLHKGDAALPAEEGESIKANYLVANADGSTKTLASEDFVCGVGGKDDAQGESYRSALPVARNHPDGTLVSTAHNPKVYLIDGDERRWILNEQVFWSHGYDFADLVLISDEELDCYSEGEMIYEIGLVDAVRDPSGTIWLVMGTSNMWNRYRIAVDAFGWQGVLTSWGLSFNGSNPPPQVSWDHFYLTGWSVKNGSARFRKGTLVRETSSPAVYVAAPEVAMPIKDWQTFLALGFFERPILWVEDGAVLAVQKLVGNCQTSTHCVSMETTSVCGGSSGSSGAGGQGGRIDPTEVEPSSTEVEPESRPEPQPEPMPEPESQPEPASQSEPEEVFIPNLNANLFCPNNELACLSDLNMDGLPEALLLADHLWIAQMLDGAPAYVYGNGGCFGGALTDEDLVTSTGEYYVVDFSQFAVDCESQITLVSTMGMDGSAPYPDMTNWMWWQGGAFCTAGSPLCHLMNNGTTWEEWLLSLAWHPNTGLQATGNGFTSNSQL